MVRIAVDAMGGDFGPYPIIEGTILALKENPNFKAILVGHKEKIQTLIPHKYNNRIEIVHAEDVIRMDEAATEALKRKESSIYKAVELVRTGEAEGVVSAGHSGATMSLATLRIGRLKNVSRPAIATLMPTYKNKKSLVLDVGANVDCKPEHLFEFGVMGEAYATAIMNVDKPKVGLLSNGEEETKGNELTKNAFTMLKSLPTFIGNVEGNNIFDGSVDVIVCDGFTGNIVLKTSEGVADAISKLMKANIKKTPIRMAGALMMKKVFRSLKKEIDYSEYGGAPLIGVKGCTIISHGKSTPKAIKNAIYQAITYIKSDINTKIEKRLEEVTPKG
ncbi:phosphate acyltransferase PlsX [Nitratiruptor sp. SB155-2]|uniref:Phosphate acyltransferase n=1 Tax=Nitratiruptor sp. (strain SB155-2) TaxID=387092 RepID=PLSX_NITSB|nr:phosphate acyltransferase PlsX [Nitratiruptor sp. SB155-2]A6Q203.1 RecName: Full=Phosphate acyltransferase; AltName: Full=Acyl-ACP phosphotransacylase; AltName: Full=Acyl-[acyl-carrier-protein]--phosphate acyltransferase; AltName: Full=Phosphate-acyl-ACP acyltransferase [Nitratiruptor sp. SB155-2]BAF69512.1 fatty acid/phospholipid synthesis protein PlsX [Nitratiruptor sp. SB155-2]